jgi:hypothetical protein
MAFPAATNIANYHLDQGAVVTAAASSADPLTILLTTSTLTYGVTYTLSVTNLTDPPWRRTHSPTQLRVSWPWNIFRVTSEPRGQWAVDPVDGGVDVTGGGKDIGGTTDQFQFGWKGILR